MKYLSKSSFTWGPTPYLIAGISISLTSLAFFPFQEVLGYQVVAYVFLLIDSILSIFFEIGAILFAVILSTIIWYYFFIPPVFTWRVDKPEDALLCCMYFIIALLNGIFTTRVKKQKRLAHEREIRTNSLFILSKQLSSVSGIDELLKVSTNVIKDYFNSECAFILKTFYSDQLSNQIRPSNLELSFSERSVADWVFKHIAKAGRFTDILPSSKFTFYTLVGNTINPGVIFIKLDKKLSVEDDIFWETLRSQISYALEREFLNEFAKKASILDESDKLYKTLFNSISHELRIPVTTIMGASETLLSIDYDQQIYRQLCSEIYTASERLNRLIENLLNMSRLESGRIKPRLDWHDVHDLANKVTENLKNELQPFNLEINIDDKMPLIKIDIGLMDQVLHNLVFNATLYAPQQTTIRIKMNYDKPYFIMQVMDRGPGIPNNIINNVFKKFHQVYGEQAIRASFGLLIVKGFVEAHQGTVNIENRKNGGTRIIVKIPSEITDWSQIQKIYEQ